MQIPLSATLTSQHKAHPAGAFSRETEYSSALSGISSMRGDYLEKPPLQRRWHAVPEESRANNVRPYRFTFSRDQRLLCPVGHLLYERRLLLLAPLLEEMASRRLAGGVPGERCSPLRFFRQGIFSRRRCNSRRKYAQKRKGTAVCMAVPFLI